MEDQMDLSEVALKTEMILEFSCLQCNQEFCMESDLIEHLRNSSCRNGNLSSSSSSVSSQLTSIRCESENSNEKDLKKHSFSTEISQNSAVITASGNFKCLLCPYIFKNLKGLKYHQSTHSTEKDFKCNQCKLTFETAHNLKFHLLNIHKKSPDEKPFECRICPSKFKQQRYLIKHQLTHVNTFDFECERCKQRYKTNASVKRHQRESCRGPKIR